LQSADATFPLDIADATELRAPHRKAVNPSTPDIPQPSKGMESGQSWGLQEGSTASSDAGGEIQIRSRQDAQACADVEVARLEVEQQRRRDAKRIYYEQKAKWLRMESWALKQRAEHLDREADEMDRMIERKMKEGTFDDDYESELSESESTMKACDDDEEERASESQRSESYAPTEVYSESEQQTWALMYQPQQGVSLLR
jgi:hypothetical protein